MKARYIPLLAGLFLLVPTARADSRAGHFNQPELEQMLAPIALYPDVLLSKVLMAATYPIEVVEAARWSRSQPHLEGNQAVEAVAQENWDLSVRELTAFPELIQLMDENLTWTRRLGEAFLLQEEELIETVQKLRTKALSSGSIDELANVKIQQRDSVIIIEPSQPQVIHVPYYNTRVVYGNWGWYDFPPVFWAPPAHYSISFNQRIYWSRPFRLYAGFGWSSVDWPCRSIVVVNPPPRRTHYSHYRPNPFPVRYTPSGSVRWQHDQSIRQNIKTTSSGERPNFRTQRIQRQPSMGQAAPSPALRPDAVPTRPRSQPKEQFRAPLNRSNDERYSRSSTPPNLRPPAPPRPGATQQVRPAQKQVRPPTQQIRTPAPQVRPAAPQAPRNAPSVQPRTRPTTPSSPPPPAPSVRVERAPSDNRYLRPDGMEHRR